jgi:NADH-quinone oxidoreductase subunit J
VNAELLIFLLLSLVTLGSALMMVRVRLITHAALFMALAFTGVSGIYLMMKAEFIAAIQVLVYAGAITTMVIFAIMLSEIRDIKAEIDRGIKNKVATVVRGSSLLTLLVASLFAVFMLYLYGGANLGPAKPAQVVAAQEIGNELFTTYLIPFEVASVLLLVAMIGAIILTSKEADR